VSPECLRLEHDEQSVEIRGVRRENEGEEERTIGLKTDYHLVTTPPNYHSNGRISWAKKEA